MLFRSQRLVKVTGQASYTDFEFNVFIAPEWETWEDGNGYLYASVFMRREHLAMTLAANSIAPRTQGEINSTEAEALADKVIAIR